MTGFATALNEITLVLFTTLAPSGAVAYVIMGMAALRAQGDERKRLSGALLIPFLVTLVGLVASATHLGNPDNALYVFSRVGASPLSNEVCAAVLFLISVAFAYASRTVVTWDTPFVPVALCLNALVGGPVLTLFCLRFSRWSPLESRVGGMLLALSSAALLANAGVYVAQGMSVLTMRNYLVSAEQLVPTYGAMATVFFLLAVAGVAVDALPLMRGRGISVASAAIASALVFAGIFVMRFAFYMMHMTYGISL